MKDTLTRRILGFVAPLAATAIFVDVTFLGGEPLRAGAQILCIALACWGHLKAREW